MALDEEELFLKTELEDLSTTSELDDEYSSLSSFNSLTGSSPQATKSDANSKTRETRVLVSLNLTPFLKKIPIKKDPLPSSFGLTKTPRNKNIIIAQIKQQEIQNKAP